jgi:hypothetical protein
MSLRRKTLKSRGSLERTPFSKSNLTTSLDPSKAKSPLKKGGKRIRARSEKTQRFYEEERIPFVKKFLSEHPNCEARLRGCQGESVDVDEIKLRSRGGDLVPTGEESNFRAVCRTCHSLITSRDPEAKSKGLVE